MPSLKDLERWMGTGQVAKYLSYSRQGVINLAEEGKIRAVKTAAGWLYDPESVEMFAAAHPPKASKGG
jgi:excisionase family DNA binding protein